MRHISAPLDLVLDEINQQYPGLLDNDEPRFKQPKATTFQFSQTGVEELSGTVEVPTPEQQERLRQWLK